MKESIIQDKTFQFALRIIDLYKILIAQNGYVISKQLLRKGTSIDANIEEATTAQSKMDIIAKMSIASKETRESRYWLRLLKESKLIDINLDSYLQEVNEIIKKLTSIVKTTQENIQHS